MDIKDLIGLAGVPVIIALVAAARPFVGDKRVWPILAMVFGIGLNVAFVAGWQDVVRAVMTGIVAGLAASGLYSGSKAMVGQ